MKRYNEVSVEELAVATDDQLKTLVELEYAYAGILPVAPLNNTPVPEVNVQPTEEVFEVAGNLFKNIADAESFQKMPRFNEGYGVDYNYKYLTPANDYYGIKPKKFYTKDDLNKVQAVLQDKKRIETMNELAGKEYDKFLKETSTVRNNVYTEYRDACRIVDKRKQAAAVYEKHLSLAEGNEEIAKKFFRDAYKNDPDIIYHILKEGIDPALEPDHA